MIEELKQMLIRDEGNVLHAYQDTEGYWTIGVGHLIDKRKGGSISHKIAMLMLEDDIAEVMGQCDREFDWFDNLGEVRKMVVLNMVFNLGINGFKKFKKTIYFIQIGDYAEAAIEMLSSKWAGQVGPRAARLSTIMKTGAL